MFPLEIVEAFCEAWPESFGFELAALQRDYTALLRVEGKKGNFALGSEEMHPLVDGLVRMIALMEDKTPDDPGLAAAVRVLREGVEAKGMLDRIAPRMHSLARYVMFIECKDRLADEEGLFHEVKIIAYNTYVIENPERTKFMSYLAKRWDVLFENYPEARCK